MQVNKKSSCCRGLASCIKRTVDREEVSNVPCKASPGYVTPGGYQTPMGYHTPGSAETQVAGSVSRCTSLNYIKDQPLSVNPTRYRNTSMIPLTEKPDQNHQHHHHHHHLHHHLHHQSTGASTLPRTEGAGSRLVSGGRLQARSHSSDSVYTILIRLPHEPSPDGPLHPPTILMIEEEAAAAAASHEPPFPSAGIRPYLRNTSPLARRGDSVCSDPSGGSMGTRHPECSLHPGGPNATSPGTIRRPTQGSNDIKLPLNAKIISKPLGKNTGSGGSNAGTGTRKKKKKKTSEKKQDRKAAKTLSAILLAFIVTWTPYNVMVLIKPILNCGKSDDCIPEVLWNFGYYLCYVNSTINPMLYALCNASFRRTYVRILTCKWHNRRRQGVQRGGYYS